ncbi:bifunctional D-glycero-beta-D-manno-heptose-7-phosphate kinase/D-glycero-beta-D-manno-heptose 1-phosphate adenylyltransferase HldE [Magnetofaba australis]|uniref:Bifunctional protein HldE n=1 Tax=Magnetofaba australis IT-1 TaxID=1434232 RepID=A0A1Y2K5N7_9PROT|nr:bifunctional D-glycero-beta-D-manno-heptose-7-phosphate kinase/D-glycero-beta-D-manno-heptose 1-phosphate adenylyltransferase HldE [Magnetofaba australis]OSM04939.1 putative D-beta-D-heptose 1-phosphate adenylyltransferase [Magnetofaba australis IT-1]
MFERREQVIDAIKNCFHGRSILVVGDLMLDKYLWGDVGRISPEAPVPVVRVTRESDNCGGAANVALNLAQLGCAVTVAGFVGDDPMGQRLTDLLAARGVRSDAVCAISGMPTITKTRIISGHQQMMRLDIEEPKKLGDNEHACLLDRVEDLISCDDQPAVVILSDYAKGVLSEHLCQEVIATCQGLGIPVMVDPKGSDYRKYRHATAISPNRGELAAATGVKGDDLNQLLEAAEYLRQELDLAFVTATLSDQGIALVDGHSGRCRIPAMAQEVFDVSGAGDTVIAVLAASLACGLTRMDALHLANVAAGVVVGHVGTTPITTPELLDAVTASEALSQSNKIGTIDQVARQIARWRAKGERIVFTNGCFDLLHAGHVTYLEHARQLGDRLIVGLNTDRSVRELKGPSRPVIQQEDRARVMAAMASVDAVVLFDEETPLNLIERFKPDILAKGADYREEEVVGGDLVKSWGGSVALVELVAGRSTSSIVTKVRGDESK